MKQLAEKSRRIPGKFVAFFHEFLRADRTQGTQFPRYQTIPLMVPYVPCQ